MKVSRFALAWLGAAAALIGTSLARPAAADSVEDFYKGRNITLYVGFSAGGGYDSYARTVARYWGNHIPGHPNFVVKNRPGAGSLILANELYNVLPKDGSVVGIFARGMAMEPLLGNKKAKFEARKFDWIGSANNEVSVCIVWHTTPVNTFNDLLTRGMVVGGTGPGADTDIFPKVLNNVIGTKLKLITGYPGGTDVNLAMERGEVEGRCGYSWSSLKSRNPDWIEQKKARILVQISLEKHPELAHVPLITEFTKDPDDLKAMEVIFSRQVMGRPFTAPPGIPAERLKALRDGFMATMKDPQYVADAQKQDLEITPVSGAEMSKLVERVYGSSARAIALAQEAVISESKTQISKKEVSLTTVSGTIAAVEKGGREIRFQVKDKTHKAKVSGSRTKITVGGKDSSRKAIKAGLVCDISYTGDGSEAKDIACK